MTDQEFYTTLEATARKFITSLTPATPGGNDPNAVDIMSNLSSNFQSDFGHSYFVSAQPHLQGQKSAEHFVNRMAVMATKLETWRIEITDIMVDERKKRAMVRGDFHMTVKEGGTVVNDLIMLLAMDETGKEVECATEFLDAEATGEIARLMQKIGS